MRAGDGASHPATVSISIDSAPLARHSQSLIRGRAKYPRRVRTCSKPGCSSEATHTLTYSYAETVAVLGPLSPSPEPHAYDLCGDHAQRFTAPNGWQVLRHLSLPPAR